MAQEVTNNNNNQEIDLRRVLGVCLKHWYWFVVGVVLCCALGVLHFFRTTPQFQTQAAIMLRQKGDASLAGAIGGGALDLLGIGVNGEASDEVEVLTSRDLMYQSLDALNLWQTHRYKDGLRWKGEYPITTFRVDTVNLTADARLRGFSLKITQTRAGGYKVKVKMGYFTSSTTKVEDLSAPIETCAGTIRL